MKLALLVGMAILAMRVGWDEYRLHKQDAEIAVYNSIFKGLAVGFNDEIKAHNIMFHHWEDCEKRNGGLR